MCKTITDSDLLCGGKRSKDLFWKKMREKVSINILSCSHVLESTFHFLGEVPPCTFPFCTVPLF